MRDISGILRAGTVCAALFGAQQAAANTWDFVGVVDVCDPLACSLAGLQVGDPLTGFLTADDAASGPDSTFTGGDILDYSIVVQELGVGPADSEIVTATATTDGAGELSSGTLEFFGEFDTGVLIVDLTVTIDLGGGTWTGSTSFLGLGEVASGTIAFQLEPDGDDVASIVDNCIERFNPDQRDTDLDLYGNACDADLDGSCGVDFEDLSLLKASFFAPGDLDTDFDGDMQTNFNDLAVMKELFFAAPGPSAQTDACSAR